MKPTTAQDRVDIVREVREAILGAGMEWARHWQSIEDEGILHGADVRLRHHDNDTTVVELDGAEVLRVRFSVDVEVLEFEDATNKPTGFTLRRTWGTVPAGWFVRDPNSRWWEVLATEATPVGQKVAMRVGGNRGEWTRDPEGEVYVRRGTLSPQDRDEALDVLGSAFETRILNDEPPGQS